MAGFTLSRSFLGRALLSVSLAAAAVTAASPASAWVAYRGGFGGAWHGPAGGGAVWHGPTVAAGPGWGYHPPAPVWNPGAAAAVGAGVGLATGVAIGAAAAPRPYPVPVPVPVVGATFAALPAGCAWTPAYGYYSCAGAWYRPYYGPSGLVYSVVPAP